MQQTTTVKLKTNDADGVSLAHPAMRPGYHKHPGACVVAIEHVPAHLSVAAVLTAYRNAAIEVSFDGPYTVSWDDLAGARPGQLGPGGAAAYCSGRERAGRGVHPAPAFLARCARNQAETIAFGRRRREPAARFGLCGQISGRPLPRPSPKNRDLQQRWTSRRRRPTPAPPSVGAVRGLSVRFPLCRCGSASSGPGRFRPLSAAFRPLSLPRAGPVVAA